MIIGTGGGGVEVRVRLRGRNNALRAPKPLPLCTKFPSHIVPENGLSVLKGERLRPEVSIFGQVFFF